MAGDGVRVLVVEDEVSLAESLRRGLTGDGFLVEVVHDGASALSFLERSTYEVVILDRDLPILHGDIVARTLRDSGSPVRVLMLTAAAAITDRITGLDLGADDYLPKPFDYEELLARLRAMERRLRVHRGFEFHDLRVDLVSHQAWCADRSVHLRPKEFAVLTELLRAQGGVVSPSALYDSVWSDAEDTDEAVVKTVVHSLRKKIGSGRIDTVHGLGYRVVGR